MGQSESGMLIYADNNNHFGLDQQKVQEEQHEMMRSLHSHGLDTHDIIESTTICESLGIRINGLSGDIQPTPHRDWRLERALWALSTRPYISGEQLQMVIGHITVRCLLNRGIMCILRHAYVFVEQSYTRRQRLWKSVASEMELIRALLPLAVSNMHSSWDEHPLCTDACLTGYAVMESDLPSEIAAFHGRQDERWRFKRQEGSKVAPRFSALEGRDVFSDVLTVLPSVEGEVEADFETNPSFPEIDKQHLDPERGHLLWNSQIFHKEPVHLIEARSILAAVKHRVRDSRRHGRRVLVLNDNMGVVLSIQKGRSSSYGLLRIIQRISSHCLASGVRLHVRWVPSELNVADAPSRHWEAKRPKKGGGFNMSEQAGEEEDRSFQQEGGAGVQQEDEHSGGGRLERKEQEGKIGIQNEGETIPDSGAGTSKYAESQREEEAESQTETRTLRQEAEGLEGRDEHLGDEQRQGATEEGLLQEARRVLRVRRPSSDRHSSGRGPRCSTLRLCRSFVSEWRRGRCWMEAQSRARVCETRGYEKVRSFPSPFPASFEGMAEDGTRADSFAHARVCQELHFWPDDVCRTEANGAFQRADVLNVRKAGRGLTYNLCGCGAQEQPIQFPCGGPGPLRKRGDEQDRDLRRGPDHGRCPSPLPGRCDGAGGSSQAGFGGRGQRSLGLHSTAVSEGLETVCGDSRSVGACNLSLSEPSWGSIKGSSPEVEVSGTNTEERTMGNRHKRPHLRQARQIAADGKQIPQGSGATGRNLQDEIPGVFLREAISPSSKAQSEGKRDFQDVKFLSLFGGVGHPALFVHSRGGKSYVVDLSDSPLNDLSRPSKWNKILEKLHLFNMLGIDLPCNTWSRARRAPWWSRMPKPLRNGHEGIFGLPGLPPHDLEKVLKANNMLVQAVRLIRKCLQLKLPGYLENPRSSFVWMTPQIQRLLLDPRVQLVHCDMCQYGTQWKKPTSLLIWNCHSLAFKLCSSSGKCSRTQKPHLQLTGIGGKNFLTAQAQVYSHEFSKHLMLTIQKSKI